MARNERHTVAVLATPNGSTFEIGVATAVFGRYVIDLMPPHYELLLCGEDGGVVDLGGGATLSTPHGLEALTRADTVIVPSVHEVEVPPSPALREALRAAHARGARMVSTCTGAFTLAAAGLLDGRRATTHWRWAPLLQERYPLVTVDPRPLYVDEGSVLTSAGSAASLDLCLHLVRRDLGAEVANALARRLVTQPHREGGQAQYIATPVPVQAADAGDGEGVARSMDWALEHLTEPLTVATLARVARMSERSYLRHFSRVTGSAPIRWLTTQRVRASLPLLERGDASVEEVSSAVGFESAVTFRHHFRQVMRTTPTAYRRGFRSAV
ncbi:helix-turn-helix domain-containing protein [Streptomyces sp. 4N509B]|uniref:helix-turn-helix domain-containing protein n=1 Tax=Streptomyces sp. 4N509B TaxID=3457413 RepID=UPI003FD084C0